MQSTHSGQRSATKVVRPLVITLITVLVVGMVLAVSACGGGGGSIVGKWVDSVGYEFEFTADGKFVSGETEGLGMTYVVDGNELTFNSDFGSGIVAEFSVDGDTLKIVDPETGDTETATRVN